MRNEIRKRDGNIGNRTYEKIKELIFHNKLHSGFKLQHKDIANQFNVSQTPVREAFNRLLEEGYLELIPNKGYYVKEITVEEAEELYDIREALELFAIKKGFKNINDTWLKKLEKFVTEYEEEVPESRILRNNLNKDKMIHLTLCEISKNENIKRMLDQVFEKTILKRITNIVLSRRRGEVAAIEHRKIFEFIQKRDLQATVKALRKHIHNGKKNTLNDLKYKEKYDVFA